MATESDELRQRLSAAILRIRRSHPFFGALALFAEFRLDDAVETAATDGKVIFVAPEFLSQLSNTQLAGLLLHEVLHCALEHIRRRGPRAPELWNVAADIVVNGMIREQTGFVLPEGSVEMPDLAGRSTEEVYSKLATWDQPPRCELQDLSLASGNVSSVFDVQRAKDLRRHWRIARRRAMIVAQRSGAEFGAMPGVEWRDFRELLDPELDWRTLLWQFVVRTPVDYSGFDRRFVGRGLYLEALESESLPLCVAIDTSASISESDLTRFLSELEGIASSYPHIDGHLYFADARLHGPYDMPLESKKHRPRGGGGTSFRPFFQEVEGYMRASGQAPLAVYFTDGYGEFPPDDPVIETLWVVPEGGLQSSGFPFGHVVRIMD